MNTEDPRKICDKCHRPRDNNHEVLCAICKVEYKTKKDIK